MQSWSDAYTMALVTYAYSKLDNQPLYQSALQRLDSMATERGIIPASVSCSFKVAVKVIQVKESVRQLVLAVVLK